MRIALCRITPCLASLLLASSLVAQPVYVCESDIDDTTLFSDLPCDDARQGAGIGVISGMDAPAPAVPAPRPPAARPATTTRQSPRPQRAPSGRLSFGERAELRGLEIERDGLERDLRKRHISAAARSRARQRLTEVNRQISALERRQ